ncbi:tachykinin-like peptides receptor 86C [Penaeus indicus]|uniref:tachykinin-like peptides receptor 86C n=1 Tax=Penaeus indicus TaxID=29960 RepID=UPI00300C9533
MTNNPASLSKVVETPPPNDVYNPFVVEVPGKDEDGAGSEGFMAVKLKAKCIRTQIVSSTPNAHRVLGSKPDGGRPSLPFQMSLHLEVIWSVAFIVLIVGACVGNVLVIMIILGNRRMKTTTNYFLLNLSGADLSMAIFNCTFNFFYMLKSHWPFGTVYCVVSQFIAHVSLAASVFTLAVISFDRMLNVIRPLKPSMSRSGCRLLLCGTWLVSALLAAPILPYATTIHSSESGRINCVIAWPDGLAMRSKTDYVYNVMILVVTYLAPMLAMIICYAIIGFKLFAWGSNQPAHQDNNIRRKKKVVQMLALLVVIFGLCWLPYHTYFIVVHHHPEFSTRPYVNHIYLAFYWLAMSNAFINPIVYYLLDARFRYFFSHLLLGAKESLEKCIGLDQSPSQYSESHDLFAIPLPEVGARGGNSTHRPPLPSSGVLDDERHTTKPSYIVLLPVVDYTNYYNGQSSRTYCSRNKEDGKKLSKLILFQGQ